MSDYVKSTNFAVKDGLTTGDSAKRVKGTEIDTEFNAIASAISSKADSNSPALTGTPLAPTASPGTSTTQIATTSFVASAVAAVFPSGGIIMWSGSIASIPSGWYLCNGSNGTPDLRDKFIIGAGNSYAVAATGGSKDAIVVSHTHTYSSTSGNGGSHYHNTVANVNVSETYPWGGGNYLAQSNTAGASGDTSYYLSGTSTTPTVARTSTASDHTHSISGTTDSTGSSGTNANLPPYYALAYIMKA